LVFPLLQLIDECGGRLKAKEAGRALASKFDLSQDVVDEVSVDASGSTTNVWRRHVRFARQKGVAMGYIAPSSDGLWQLTDEGREGLAAAKPRISVLIFIDPTSGQPKSAQFDVGAALPTIHTLHCGDSRDLSWIDDSSIQLVVTSAPYFDLIDYGADNGQLAQFDSYERFLTELDAVWKECFRVLAPGGRIACNIGDVLRSRKAAGRHHVLPLHADILVRTRSLGFDALTGVLWQKFSNCNFEQGGNGILGKPGQPNQIVRSEIEHILLLKKPGPYRKPTSAQQIASRISKEEQQRWFKPVWNDVSGARSGEHPAPFPVEIPYRLMRMCSFAGDTILDPFAGSGSTTLAAMKAGRNSIGVELSPRYFSDTINRLRKEGLRYAA
jgi:DNA modification methylase